MLKYEKPEKSRDQKKKQLLMRKKLKSGTALRKQLVLKSRLI